MSTATAFSDSATTPPDHPEHHSTPEPTSWQGTVLDLLTQGASVAAAMRHVGYSSAAFYKACNRHPEFRVEAGRARNAYRTQVAEEFHDAEAFARVLVDSVMRDEALPASLRLRAALAILNRKGDRWLPSPIPDDGVDTVDTMDTTNIMGLMDIVDTMDTVDTTGIPIPQPRPGLTTSGSGHSPNSAPGAPSIFSADRSRVTLPLPIIGQPDISSSTFASGLESRRTDRLF